jgi:thiamine pyrophosphokinase
VTRPLLTFQGAVTLVGGGPVDPGQLAQTLAFACDAVAADGGGDVVLPGGREFAAVIGDLDSFQGREALRARGVAIHEIAEQDSTDLEKCLRSVEAPLYLGLGFLGGRIDHQLAAMNALVKFAAKTVVLIGAEDLCFICPPDITIEVAPGERVSLFPMAAVRGTISEGLRWSVAGLEMSPDARIGSSNIACGGRLRLGFDRSVMLVILPVRLLGPVLRGLGA